VYPETRHDGKRSCNYYSQAIRHKRHLLSTELAVTLACSLILTRLDYCNSVLYGAPASSIQVLQRVQNDAARIVHQAPRRSHAQPLLRELHWLPIQHRIKYKVGVLNENTMKRSPAPSDTASITVTAPTLGALEI